MSTPSQHVVEVGDEKFTIQRFRGLKAIMAMASMTRIAREVPDVMADAVKQYQRRNTVTITEDMARLPRWRSFTTEDFDAAEAKSGRREIEIPAPMTANEQVMYALPTLLEHARKEVTRLIALLIIPNEELREADKTDKVEDALDKYEELLLMEAEIDQLVDVALAASDVLKEQMGERKDRLGNMLAGLWRMFQTNRVSNQTSSEEIQATLPPTTDPESTQLTSSEDAPTSSTSSDEPTDGAGTERSMASLGSNS